MDNPTKADNGHAQLIGDLEALLAEVRDYAFHDFKNKEFAAPKIVLAERFQTLGENVINGKYDN